MKGDAKLGKREAPKGISDNMAQDDENSDPKRTSILDRIKPKKGESKNTYSSPMKGLKKFKTDRPDHPQRKPEQPAKPPGNPHSQNTDAQQGQLTDEQNLEAQAQIPGLQKMLEEKFADKKKKRCLFWPNCKNDPCEFIHPTEECPKFPKCSFGEQCFYIHPSIPCKFGTYCQRPNCSYTHPQGWQGGYNMAMMYNYAGYRGYPGANPYAQGNY